MSQTLPTSDQLAPAEEHTSEISESYSVSVYERVVRYYNVRAENLSDAQDNCPEDLTVMSEDYEYLDSDGNEVKRFLSDEENEERLKHHELWQEQKLLTKSEKEAAERCLVGKGERYCINSEAQCEVSTIVVGQRHQGAIFKNCLFEDVTFKEADLSTMSFIDCKFRECRVTSCTGIRREVASKPGSLWYHTTKTFRGSSLGWKNKSTPVVVKKWEKFFLTEEEDSLIGEEAEFLKDGKIVSFRPSERKKLVTPKEFGCEEV
jgi:hypothetical protein